MWITVNKVNAVKIDARSVEQILNLYPEEDLLERSVFKEALNTHSMELDDLRSESEKILIPWQLFLLDPNNLDGELKHIENMRRHKVSAKLLAKRKGVGNITSRRIIDRLIRLQNFISDGTNLPKNQFCGSLINKGDEDVIKNICTYFDIDMEQFRGKNKAGALKYLIEKIENQNINVSQGVLTNKILPNHRVVKNLIYKNTSGFVLQDDKMPFIFLPSEINPDEVDGRQIYTLIFLLVLIGLSQYDFSIGKELGPEVLVGRPALAKVHRITSELLLPTVITEKLRGTNITLPLIETLSSDYKITPTAVLFTLWNRGYVSSKKEYDSLKPPPYTAPKTRTQRHAPNIDTSVKKFCGRYAFNIVNKAIASGMLKNIQAQYLLFGYVNKKGFKDYRHRLNI